MAEIFGRYRHYKGGLYEVIALAKHSETLEELVIYRSLTEPEKVWARPKQMWAETVTVDGKTRLRFEPLEDFSYEIVRSDRKTLALHLLPDGRVQVRAPRRVSETQIAHFVEQHRGWIEKRQPGVLARNEKLKAQDADALAQKAKAYLPGRVAHYAEKMGVRPKGVRITSAKKRFGSCSSENMLNFSCYLMLEDAPQIDYVVVHELAHIRHKNHSAAFYAEIEKILPDYRVRERVLKGRERP